jgi:hypothetical protein
MQFQDRLNDLNLLRSRLQDLERKMALRNNQLSNMEALKNEVHPPPAAGTAAGTDQGQGVI